MRIQRATFLSAATVALTLFGGSARAEEQSASARIAGAFQAATAKLVTWKGRIPGLGNQDVAITCSQAGHSLTGWMSYASGAKIADILPGDKGGLTVNASPEFLKIVTSMGGGDDSMFDVNGLATPFQIRCREALRLADNGEIKVKTIRIKTGVTPAND